VQKLSLADVHRMVMGTQRAEQRSGAGEDERHGGNSEEGDGDDGEGAAHEGAAHAGTIARHAARMSL
jgi:hypothetical protein